MRDSLGALIRRGARPWTTSPFCLRRDDTQGAAGVAFGAFFRAFGRARAVAGHVSARRGPAAADLRHDCLLRRFRRDRRLGRSIISTFCGGSRSSISAFPASAGCATLVNRVDPILFGRCFESWIAALWPDRHDLIAIDGKTSRRTHDKRKGLKALHTLSAYATNARLTLAQLSVPEKTNEITAIPDLLDQLAETKQLEGRARHHRRHGLPGRDRRQDRRPQGRLSAGSEGQSADARSRCRELFRQRARRRTRRQNHASRKAMAASRRASTRPRAIVDWIGSDRSYPGAAALHRHQDDRSRFTIASNTPTDAASTRALHLLRARSTSNASPPARAAIGASKACTGCSMSSSRTICRATAPATAPRTWPSSAASPSASSAPTKPREASKPRRKAAGWNPDFLLEILQLK